MGQLDLTGHNVRNIALLSSFVITIAITAELSCCLIISSQSSLSHS